MSSRWNEKGASTAWRHAWRKQRLRILARDGYLCQLKLPGCTITATQVDHLVPWTPGAAVPDHQLLSACAHCNSSAGSPEKRNPPVEPPSWL